MYKNASVWSVDMQTCEWSVSELYDLHGNFKGHCFGAQEITGK